MSTSWDLDSFTLHDSLEGALLDVGNNRTCMWQKHTLSSRPFSPDHDIWSFPVLRHGDIILGIRAASNIRTHSIIEPGGGLIEIQPVFTQPMVSPKWCELLIFTTSPTKPADVEFEVLWGFLQPKERLTLW